MKIKICFDFHDIFVNAREAWIEAFSSMVLKDKDEIISDYNNKMSKKKICQKHELNYELVEDEYRKILKPISKNIEVAKKMMKYHDIDLISLSRESRLKKDLKKFELLELFNRIYSKNDVIERNQFLQKYSSDCDMVIYFNHEENNIKIINKVIYVPINIQTIKIEQNYIIIAKDDVCIKFEF